MKRGQLTRKTELKAKKPLPHAARPGDRIQRQKPMPRLCTVCGDVFDPEQLNGAWTRQCGPECRTKAEKPRSTLSPGKRKQRSKGDGDRWNAGLGPACEVCGATAKEVRKKGLRLRRHHVLYQQEIARLGGDEWDPDIGMTVCDGPLSCHGQHHSAKQKIELVKIPDAAYFYAVALMGPAKTYEYFRRHYRGDDERLDSLIR